MKKLLLKSMLLLCALIVGSQCGWATDATFNWASGGNMTTSTGKVGNITLTGAANSASNAPAVTSNTLRLYAHRSSGNGSSATFTADAGYKISAIEVTSSNGGTILKYATDGGSSFSVFSFSEGVATVSGLDVSSITLKNCQNSGSSNTTIQISKVIITYSSSGSTPSSDVSFEYSARSMDLKDATSFTQTATTADGYEGEDGASVTYSMIANTAGASINASTGEVTPTQAGSVTVQASAAAITGKFLASTASYTLTVTDTRVWTVTYHVGGYTSNENRTSGATLSLDNPSPICGMSFVGWSSTNNATSPTWVANTTKVTGDMELYAMYQAVEGQYSYHLVESDLADWRGNYLIAYSSSVFADGRVGGTGTNAIGAEGVFVNPSTNLSGKIIAASWGDMYNVILEAIDESDLSNGYVMKTKDGKYNYYTSNNNGLSSTETKLTASAYPITVTFTSSSDVKLKLGGGATGAVFRYNSGGSGYFRFYKNGGQNAVYLYKRTEDVAPVYSLGITEEITIGVSKYATYCSTQALCFATTDVKAYKAKVTDNKVVLTKVDAVPANEGVILFCDVAGDYDIPVIPAADAVTENELIGVNTKTKIAYDGAGSKKNYILANGASGVGFYKASTTGANLAAHKAYLSTENAVAAREFLGFGEETTGVADVIGKMKDGRCDFFDLQGRKVAQPTKGLYIVNGKKVIIK